MKSFLTWVENEETTSLSEPQHKKGEANMALDKIVEKRIRSIIMDLESSGKGTQKEILDSLIKYAKKMGVDKVETSPQPQDQQSPQPPQPQDQQPPQPQSPTMQNDQSAIKPQPSVRL